MFGIGYIFIISINHDYRHLPPKIKRGKINRALHCMKSVRIWSFCGSYFLVRTRTEYGDNPCIQSDSGKIRARKTPNTYSASYR